MKKSWLAIIASFLALILVGLVIKAKFFSRPGPGAISVSANPKSMVFIDGVQVGITPFLNDKAQPGEHTVRIVPDPTAGNLMPWEGRVNLTPGILTVINRNLASTEAASSGNIINLEKIGSRDKASLSVISVPDGAVVRIDDEPKGFAPIAEDYPPGSYRFTVASPGYEELTISAKAVTGYKLIINVKLAQKIEGIEKITPTPEEKENLTPTPKVTTNPKSTPTPKAEITPPEKPYVKIKETPTGWLRVRSEPSTSATELVKVYPQDMFPYLNEEQNGWYKIEYEKNKEGWVSATYVQLIK